MAAIQQRAKAGAGRGVDFHLALAIGFVAFCPLFVFACVDDFVVLRQCWHDAQQNECNKKNRKHFFFLLIFDQN